MWAGSNVLQSVLWFLLFTFTAQGLWRWRLTVQLLKNRLTRAHVQYKRSVKTGWEREIQRGFWCVLELVKLEWWGGRRWRVWGKEHKKIQISRWKWFIELWSETTTNLIREIKGTKTITGRWTMSIHYSNQNDLNKPIQDENLSVDIISCFAGWGTAWITPPLLLCAMSPAGLFTLSTYLQSVTSTWTVAS